MIRDRDIVGLKYFDRLMPLLERLHDVGTQRDRAGNRSLFFDQYCAFILLFLFNPIVTSLRGRSIVFVRTPLWIVYLPVSRQARDGAQRSRLTLGFVS